MSSFRRWYFYVVSAVSLQAVTWAVIALLRNLLIPWLFPGNIALEAEAQRIAFQISVILVGLPLFIFHWRRAGTAVSLERAIYLYVMLALFLIPLLVSSVSFLQSLLRILTGTPHLGSLFEEVPPDRANLVFTALPLLVLGVMIAYHARLLRQDRRQVAPDSLIAVLHRLFLLVFSGAGLFLTCTSGATLLSLLLEAPETRTSYAPARAMIESIAVLLVGLVLWLVFWWPVQSLFRSAADAETRSLLRKLYLYLVIFLAILATVAALTALLAGFFRQWLGLEPVTGGGVVAATLLVAAAVWIYHALVLREDTRQMPLQQEQAGVRRLYRYLVAGVGLLALLIGLGGVLGVLFDPGGEIVSRQREDLSWFAATLIAGLVVWILPWRLIQQEIAAPPPASVAARTSVVRRFYLYFFLLLATITFLVSAVFILSRLLTLLLGETLARGDLRAMGLAAAYLLMAAAVWLYHGWLLREDGRALEALLVKQAANLRVVVVDDGDGRFGRALLDSLAEALDGIQLSAVGLTASAAAAMGGVPAEQVDPTLATADIIAGPWSIAAAHAGLDTDEALLAAVAASPAHKIIVPRPVPGWQWAAAKEWDAAEAVSDTTAAVAQLVAGEGGLTSRRMTVGMILLLAAATFLLFILITSLLQSVLPLF